MATIKAKCISTNKLDNGLQSAVFKCKLDDKKDFDEPEGVTLKVITSNKDLEAEWIIKCDVYDPQECDDQTFRLKKIKLGKHNKKIIGSLVFNCVIRAWKDNDFENKVIAFDSNKSPFEYKVREEFYGSDVTAVITICYADETLNEDFEKFMKNGKLSDVIFVVKNEEIRAHKQIISARNDVIAKMFTSDMTEKKTGRVKISDVEPKIFKLVLRYIYSEKFESNDTDELLKVIVAADKYLMKNLVEICAHRLSDKLSVKNVVDVLKTAELVNEDFLKVECAKFMKKNKMKTAVASSSKAVAKSRRADSSSVEDAPLKKARRDSASSYSSVDSEVDSSNYSGDSSFGSDDDNVAY